MNPHLAQSLVSTANSFFSNNAAKYHVAFGTVLVAGVAMYDKKAKQVKRKKTYTNQYGLVPKRGEL
jgi:hypothetical protein